MSQLSLVTVNQPVVVDSLLVELAEQTLLLPMSAVAEVVREVSPIQADDLPDWMYGWLNWRNMEIPLCSYEKLTGQPKPELPNPAHAVVLNTLSGGDELPFIALLIQNFPSPIRLAEDDKLEVVEEGSGTHIGALLHVTIEDQTAVIPDLEQLEQQILQAIKY